MTNLITRKQAAERAGVHPRTIDRYRALGLLTTYERIGSQERVWIDREELEELIKPVQKTGARA